MTVKHSPSALLAEQPAHSYQLKTSFEDRTGGAWLLNIGQVYTTLQRLERDGLVVAADLDGQRTAYRLTGHRPRACHRHGPAMTDDTPAVRLAAAGRVFGAGRTEVVALHPTDLSVAHGELVAVMGPSGSGKSILLMLAGGLDRPTAGRVEVEGADLQTLDRAGMARLRRRAIGYVFQELNLMQGLTAIENLMPAGTRRHAHQPGT